VSGLQSHVEQTIHTRRLFLPGQRILVAVSGGVDSIVLLHLLHQLSRKNHWRLTVAHLNHRLRGRSSDADERLVRRAAAKLKLPVAVERVDVRRLARTLKLSLEMAARYVRHEFLARTAAHRQIPAIALAHHADDQLELFFLRLLRGSGGEGLTGMKCRSRSPNDSAIELIRPLLDQPKKLLRQFSAEQGLRHREDATNAQLDFQRNRIRHELLPLLRRNYQPALDKTLPRVMEILGAEAEFAVKAAEAWLRESGRSKAPSPRPKVRVRKAGKTGASLGWLPREWSGERDQPGFEKLPVAVQRRCVQLQLAGQGITPEFELVEQLRLKPNRSVAVGASQTLRTAAAADVSRLGSSQAMAQPAEFAGCVCYAVRDHTGLVRLHHAAPVEFRADAAEVDLQGRTGELEFGGAKIEWRIYAGRGGKRPSTAVRQECFDADKVGSPVVLRHWRLGDRFQPIGMAGRVKLQDIFTNQKVPRTERHRLIVATTAMGEVFWIEGMRISERFKLTQDTIRRLQWRWKRL